MRRATRHGFIAAACCAMSAVPSAAPAELTRFEVRGDRIPAPLTATPGDAERGRRIALARDEGGCALCHAFPGAATAGNIGPPLAGVGRRLDAAQLRLRVVDSSRLDPATPMPAYYRVEGLNRVAAQYRGKPVLSAQQVEDVVAWLGSLQDAGPQDGTAKDGK